MHLDDGDQELLRPQRVEGAVGGEDEALHVVVAVMVMGRPAVAVRVMAMHAAAVAVVAAVPVRVLRPQEIRIGVERRVQIEAAQVEHGVTRGPAEPGRGDGGPRIHPREPPLERLYGLRLDQIRLGQEDPAAEADPAACLLEFVELPAGMPRVREGGARVVEVACGHLPGHEEGLRHRPGVGKARGLDDNPVEVEQALMAPLGQHRQPAAQSLADRASRCSRRSSG